MGEVFQQDSMKPGCSERRMVGDEGKNDEDRLGFSLCRQSVDNYTSVPFFQSFTSYLFSSSCLTEHEQC